MHFLAEPAGVFGADALGVAPELLNDVLFGEPLAVQMADDAMEQVAAVGRGRAVLDQVVVIERLLLWLGLIEIEQLVLAAGGTVIARDQRVDEVVDQRQLAALANPSALIVM